MTDDGIKDEVKDFLSRYIDSVEGLEVLLLLKKEPKKQWTGHSVSQVLRSEPISASKRLQDLSLFALLQVTEIEGTPHYRYSPENKSVSTTIDALEIAYAERRVRVIDLIFSKPVDKVRVFADAFKFRKD